jgi:hypothetical protein
LADAINYTSMRGAVLDLIKPLLPKTWAVLPGQMTDSITKTTVALSLNTIERLPQAPISQRIVSYTLTIAVPMAKASETDDRVDDDILTLLNALDDVPGVAWTRAERGVLGQNPGFDITLTFTFEKETS